jgi:HTH-type transcriptional regulator / antitoxin HigA
MKNMTGTMLPRFNWRSKDMYIKPIKTEIDYKAALLEVEHLFNSAPNTPEGDRLEVLTTLLEAYEEEHYGFPAPDPIETILHYLESRGLSRCDLEPYIGSRARVSEVLNRKRPLTIYMIRKLHTGLGIPAEILIQPYSLQESAASENHRHNLKDMPGIDRVHQEAEKEVRHN